MAGEQISNYSQLDSNILEMQLTLDQTRKGMHQVSLTNYDNTSLPAIAAGSVIEVDGALYKFASEEAIGGSPSDGTVYIKIIPSTITAEFTNTAPTWSDSKQGWYGTAGSATHRYLEFKMTKATAAYSKKRKFFKDLMEFNVNSVSYESVHVAGFLTDGTPYFAVQFLYSFSSSTSSAAITHNIPNAATNHRIINTQHTRYSAGSDSVGYFSDTIYTFTDTTLTLISGTSQTTNGIVTVFYK